MRVVRVGLGVMRRSFGVMAVGVNIVQREVMFFCIVVVMRVVMVM